MNNKITIITEDESRKNIQNNKDFLSEAEKKLNEIQNTKGHIYVWDILKVLGF